MTKFEARDIRTTPTTIPGLKHNSASEPTTPRTSFNLYADGVLCGRLTMRPDVFDEFTDRMRSEEL